MESFLMNIVIYFFEYAVCGAVVYLAMVIYFYLTAATAVSTITLEYMISRSKYDAVVAVFEVLIEKAKLTQKMILPVVSVLLLFIYLYGVWLFSSA